MNINKTLLRELVTIGPPTVDYLKKYDCDKDVIEDFLITPRSPEKRQSLAISIIEDILKNHSKEDLIYHVAKLAKIKKSIQKLLPLQRDHVVHALICFILGIYINESWLPKKVDKFEWKLACLLHDICYPAVFAFKILTSIPINIGEIANNINCPTPVIKATTKIEGLENLHNNINVLDLIQNRVKEWSLNIDVEKEYYSMQEREPCHGMYSALSALLVLDMMHQKNNPLRLEESHNGWNQKDFDGQILNACSAIFLHNLPASSFSTQKINRRKAPTAFLLKLCDSLQEWERPSKENPSGEPASKFDIRISSKGLELIAQLSNETPIEMRRDISETLGY